MMTVSIVMSYAHDAARMRTVELPTSLHSVVRDRDLHARLEHESYIAAHEWH